MSRQIKAVEKHDDGTVAIAYPAAASSLNKHVSFVEARRCGDQKLYLSVEEVGPRGGSSFASATVSETGIRELREQVRPREIPNAQLMFARADRVQQKAEDTTARLETISRAVALLRDVETTGPGEARDKRQALAAIQPLVAEVSELLALALQRALPELEV